MIRVQMGNGNQMDSAPGDPNPNELPLRSLTAVEQKESPFHLHKNRCGSPAERRGSAGSTA